MRLNLKSALLLLFDTGCFFAVISSYYLLSNLILSEYSVADTSRYLVSALVLFAAVFAARIILGIYSTIWRYENTRSYFKLILADGVGTVFAAGVSIFLNFNITLMFFVTASALTLLLTLISRYSYHLIYVRRRKSRNMSPMPTTNIAIIGAGMLGVSLANELVNNSRSKYKPVCFVDSDETKIDGTIADIKVCSPKNFTEYRDKYNITDVVIAMARVNGDRLSRICDFYKELGCNVKIYDMPIHDVNKKDTKRVIRDFQIEDLLFRDPLSIKSEETEAYYSGKTVLVTGGGGSIGSELCRQIAACNPRRLVIFDVYENNAYEIQQELLRRYEGSFELVVEIGTVRDVARLEYVFDKHRPDIVFHAAAHKHVPLMEDSSCEAIKNNVVGTYNTANIAEKYSVEKFILISTDKAVNPTNIMGASKRLCEMIIQCRVDSKTSFAAVRFGNVLGSNGSVIPLFKKQIENGGPITITDKRIIRYFMTIPEASQLVMTAGVMAKRGELFVLDMGKPVRIYDLAENMIKLSGFVPNKDIMIEEIGLRPGEKLFEELLMKTETLSKTSNNMIFIERDQPLSREEVDEKIRELNGAVVLFEENAVKGAIKDAIRRLVPTYRDPEDINRTAEKSEEMKMAQS